ncbi:Motility protein B, N-terminal domain containing protein [Desulfovibrio sp. X2]|uniref:flagellar motor protein MotB n=1 Tax=Desulfovibrio sp. X2 TaxID=941449 RepID=UPI000358CE45|nr:flagellar motor protein MotB [Desulfovibrio sp. X2]EPR43375.1 Motility protein B, N-terminal domain containing protein [Desulfovibrio sp. X2]
MPKAEQQQPIIRKVIKKGGHGHHGGSWKVAYADFVTAMMAFFLLMWLLNSTSSAQKAALSDYFNDFNIFQSGSSKPPMPETGGAVVSMPTPNPPPALEETKPSELRQKLLSPPPERALTPQQIQQELQKTVKEKLGDMADQVLLSRTPEGVRVQVTATDGNPIFDSGSPHLTQSGLRALEAIGASLAGLPNRIAIEGHTDAKPFVNGSGQDNWDLSAERALSARKALMEAGMDPTKVARVAGFAASMPLLPDKPEDARNRRISILVIDDKAAKAKTGEERFQGGVEEAEPPREPVKTKVADPNAPDKLFTIPDVTPPK